jgi:putative hydrolase of the HAD superfamily
MGGEVRALLVDLYDTLVWTDWGTLSERLTRRLGIDPLTLGGAFEITSAARGTGRYGSVAGDFRAILNACGMKADEDLIAELAAETVDYLCRNVHLFDDVLPVLRQMRAAGTPVALVSNCDHATRPIVEALGLPAEVDALLLSCEVACAKPDAGIFVEALRRLDAPAEGSLFVDDQPRFLEGAAALGIRPVRIARGATSLTPSALTAHRVISSLTELL